MFSSKKGNAAPPPEIADDSRGEEAVSPAATPPPAPDENIEDNSNLMRVTEDNMGEFVRVLFLNGNQCLTTSRGSFPIKEDTRALLALFSDGRFIVSETHRFDGRVLSFEVLARKRRVMIKNPEYVPLACVGIIYERAAAQEMAIGVNGAETEAPDYIEMQRDFVTLVAKASESKVSDIHVVIGDHAVVLFRMNGLMHVEAEYSKEWGESFVRAAFASADISDSNYAQNEYQSAQKVGRTPLRGSKGRLMLPGNVLAIRLQFNPIAFGTRYLVMRLLYADESSGSSRSLTALGFTERDEELMFRLRAVPTGVVILSGPTGSGKSTTLQRNMISMLKENQYEINLLTVEDPPEYPIPGARQMPVTNASSEEQREHEFTRALSASLRSDPDMLMIGEVRTLSAAQLTFRGALSGHGVWTTLHANSAMATLIRLLDMGVEAYKLRDPDLMRGFVAQRLFRKLCPHCRVKAKSKQDHPAVQRLKTAYGAYGVEHSYLRGPGCNFCGGKGFIGRMVASEILIPDQKFLNYVMDGFTQKAIDYWLVELEGRSLRENAIHRMLEGVFDIEEIERWTGLLDIAGGY